MYIKLKNKKEYNIRNNIDNFIKKNIELNNLY